MRIRPSLPSACVTYAGACVVLATALSACAGAPRPVERRCPAAAYQAQPGAIWAAVEGEVTDRHGERLVAEQSERRLVTEWLPTYDWPEIQWYRRDPTQRVQRTEPGDRFVRLTVVLAGGPPWRIAVEGEGAVYRATRGGSRYRRMPGARFAAAEAEAFRCAIHERLRAYAR